MFVAVGAAKHLAAPLPIRVGATARDVLAPFLVPRLASWNAVLFKCLRQALLNLRPDCLCLGRPLRTSHRNVLPNPLLVPWEASLHRFLQQRAAPALGGFLATLRETLVISPLPRRSPALLILFPLLANAFFPFLLAALEERHPFLVAHTRAYDAVSKDERRVGEVCRRVEPESDSNLRPGD
jgi:hypothetical protein